MTPAFTDGLGSIIGATYFPLPNWQNLDWGLSQINLNHNFTASIIYELPFGKGQKWGSNWNGVANAIAGRLGDDRDRTCHLRVSHLCHRQQQHPARVS